MGTMLHLANREQQPAASVCFGYGSIARFCLLRTVLYMKVVPSVCRRHRRYTLTSDV